MLGANAVCWGFINNNFVSLVQGIWKCHISSNTILRTNMAVTVTVHLFQGHGLQINESITHESSPLCTLNKSAQDIIATPLPIS